MQQLFKKSDGDTNKRTDLVITLQRIRIFTRSHFIINDTIWLQSFAV